MTELEPIRRRLVAGVVIVDDLPLGAGRQLLLGRGEAGNCLVSVGEPNGIAVSPFQLGWQQGEGGALTDAFPDSLYPLGALVPDWAGQPARLETATLLDPDRIALDALRGADLPTRLSWVLELVTLIREQAKLAAAFDPAALAFSPSPPHLRSIDPQAPAGSESEIVRGLATTATLLLTSSLPREDRVPVGRISPVLVDLLERALDSRAGVRPSLATLGAGLQRALAERDYAWRPREHPSASLIAVACTLAALWALGQVSAPASPREAAQGAFVAAAAESEQNPAGARLALERLAQGSPLLPEARR
ncbi:MAG: hypothetical protein JKY65_02695, partial [Planctomycetes bacterium]|nr:hypothetical protein [Planctomycetota bacterium]